MGKKERKITILSNWQIIVGATLLFAVLMIFVDSNNIQVKMEVKKKIEILTQERDSIVANIRSDSLIIEGIEKDDRFLERYAREHFYMKREGEDLFLVQPKK